MANIFQNPTHVAKLGYNGFDMGQKLKFSSTVGELLPVYYDILHPGDKVTCQIELKTRLMPIQSAAMAHLTQHVEWFFVPMKQIYSLFGAFYYNVSDLESSIFNTQSAEATLPYVPAGDMDAYINDIGTQSDAYFSTLTGTGLRLLELLGIPWESTHQNQGSALGFCPLLLCAYQKIYYDYYRFTEREENNPSAYNLDKYYATPTSITMADLRNMTTLHYRRWRPDFFTHNLPSPLFGEAGIGSMGYNGGVNYTSQLVDAMQQWLTATNFNTFGVGAWTSSTDPSQNSPSGSQEMASNNIDPTVVAPEGVLYRSSGTNYMQYGNLQQSLSPTSIRSSFAIQKLLEITRRAGKHYDAQQLAHFGVKLPKGLDGEVTFLGAQESDIRIGDVIATASGSTSSSSSVLGQVGGKGYGFVNQGTVKFSAPCDGILMAIYSCEPYADYDNLGFDKLNLMMDRSAWYTPEYDNLGMQPLFQYQSDADATGQPTNILGWQYRYMEFKAKYNKICGSLRGSSHMWTPGNVGFYSNLKDYYIRPTYLNTILYMPYDFNPHLDDQSQLNYDNIFGKDPLIHEVYFDVKKASKMSVYGLENL